MENKVKNEVEELKKLSLNKNIALLDYETNCDVENLSKPLSHAFLIKKYIENEYPEVN